MGIVERGFEVEGFWNARASGDKPGGRGRQEEEEPDHLQLESSGMASFSFLTFFFAIFPQFALEFPTLTVDWE